MIYSPRNRQRNLGPLFAVQGYARTVYDHVGKTMMWLCGVLFVTVLVGSIVATIVMGLIGVWQWAGKKIHPPKAPAPVEQTVDQSSYLPDPCGLWAVECPGEPVTVAGIASFLDYQLPDTCAARDWPKQTKLLVSANGRSVTCVVRDFGPEKAKYPDRIVDLNRNQFAELESPRRGLVQVTVTPI